MKDPEEIERRLRLLAEQSKDHAFILLDLQGRILSWSPGAEHIFGRSSAEMANQQMSCLFTPEDIQTGIPAQEIAMALEVGKAEDDRWLLRADGSRFWATGMLVAHSG